MEELDRPEYWAIVDGQGRLHMQNVEIGATPLYIGKHKALAESIQKLEDIVQSHHNGEGYTTRVAKISVQVLTANRF